jgi:hypothetical protein
MRRDGRFHDGFYNGRFVAWFFCSVAGIDSLANKRRRVTGKQGHALATPKGGLCFILKKSVNPAESAKPA